MSSYYAEEMLVIMTIKTIYNDNPTVAILATQSKSNSNHSVTA